MRRFTGALIHIDMGIGIIPRQGVTVPDDAWRHVGVQIQRGNDWHIGANQPAYGLEHMALTIVQVVRYHGAVQMQQHPVNLAGGLNPFEQMSTEICQRPRYSPGPREWHYQRRSR